MAEHTLLDCAACGAAECQAKEELLELGPMTPAPAPAGAKETRPAFPVCQFPACGKRVCSPSRTSLPLCWYHFDLENELAGLQRREKMERQARETAAHRANHTPLNRPRQAIHSPPPAPVVRPPQPLRPARKPTDRRRRDEGA